MKVKGYQIWAYRNVAWAVNELEVNIANPNGEKGLDGLTALPGVFKRIAGQIVQWLEADIESH